MRPRTGIAVFVTLVGTGGARGGRRPRHRRARRQFQ